MSRRGLRFESRQECDTCGEDIVFEVHDDTFGARYVTVTHSRPGSSSHLRRSEPIMLARPGWETVLSSAMLFVTHTVLQRTECLEYHLLASIPGWDAVSESVLTRRDKI